MLILHEKTDSVCEPFDKRRRCLRVTLPLSWGSGRPCDNHQHQPQWSHIRSPSAEDPAHGVFIVCSPLRSVVFSSHLSLVLGSVIVSETLFLSLWESDPKQLLLFSFTCALKISNDPLLCCIRKPCLISLWTILTALVKLEYWWILSTLILFLKSCYFVYMVPPLLYIGAQSHFVCDQSHKNIVVRLFIHPSSWNVFLSVTYRRS